MQIWGNLFVVLLYLYPRSVIEKLRISECGNARSMSMKLLS